MAVLAYRDILSSIGALPPETGGILLGPVGSNDVVEFFFDQGGSCSTSTYSPDHVALMRKMREEWLPAGIDMKGFVHSHPGRYARLSPGDLVYIRRLLDINPDMEMFAAPIVVPFEFRLCPIVVLRADPTVGRHARLVLF